VAESPASGHILTYLNENTERLFHLAPYQASEIAEGSVPVGRSTRVALYSQLPRDVVEYRDNPYRKYLSLNRIRWSIGNEILVAAIHFPSKIWRSHSDQKTWACRISDEIRNAERALGHTRTVLVGDLNMNPFEDAMISADGFHGVMTIERALKGSRTHGGKHYAFFYNPMWGLFGDNSQGPPGTFHRQGSDILEYFWHIYDQVLIRPSLLEGNDRFTVRILDRSLSTSFLSANGLPDVDGVSDHLPLLFNLRV